MLRRSLALLLLVASAALAAAPRFSHPRPTGARLAHSPLTRPFAADADGDGYGAASSGGRDCDDSNPAVNPGAAEIWYDGIDGDCDGASDYDADGDGVDSSAYGGADCDDADAASGGGWTVPGDADTIQEAIDGACEGETITIGAGTWKENLVLGDKALRLVGEGSGETLLDGDGAGPVLTISGAADLAISALTITNGSASSGGGIYAVDNGALVLSDLVFSGNSATSEGGGLYLSTTGEVDLSLDNVLFEGNDAPMDDFTCSGGGAAISARYGGSITWTSVTFTGNSAYNGGAADLYLKKVDLVLDEVLVTENTSDVGGLHFETSSGTIALSQLTFSDNTADMAAGLWAYTGGEITVEDMVVTGNTAAQDPGIYWYFVGGSLDISNLELSGNTGYNAMYLVSGGGDTTLTDLTVTDNTDTAAYSNYAAGIYLKTQDSADTLTLTGVTATGNRSSLGVGAIRMHFSTGLKEATISDLDVWDNTGDLCGGVYLVNGSSRDSSTVTLQRVTSTENIGGSYGGLYVQDTASGTDIALELYDLEITQNSGDYAAYLYASSSVEVDASGMNISGNEGAGLYVNSFVDDGEVSLANLSIVGNTGDGVTYNRHDNDGSDLLTNVVIAYNGGYGVYRTGTYAPTFAYSDVYGNTSGAYEDITDPTGSSGNVKVDPEFLAFSADGDPGLWDLHLADGSPLLDAGSASITDGAGGRSDIGAYGGATDDGTWYDDADGDGLYDGWELAHGLDSSTDDSAEDADSDGLDNADEQGAGTDPQSTDTDGDGTSDAVEVAAGTDPLDDEAP